MENLLSIANRLTIADIPTLSFLYRNNLLSPSLMEAIPIPDQAVNDKICTIQADITTLSVDVIVTAANPALRGGGGVDGAVHRAAGPRLLQECAALGGCPTGSAKITNAYNLPCQKVIHAVGPIFRSESASEPLLRAAYHTALNLAVQHGLKTIAFPAISTGVYGYPSHAAARAAISEICAFVKEPKGVQLDKIIFCNFTDSDVDAYSRYLPFAFPPTQDDLSHTGEYDLHTDEFPMEMSPTDTQTHSRAKSEPAVTTLSQPAVDEHSVARTHTLTITSADVDEANRRHSYSASPEMSPRREDHLSYSEPGDTETEGSGEGKASSATGKAGKVSTKAALDSSF